MLRHARSIGITVAFVTPVAFFTVGEVAQHYDDRNKASYAKQRLQKWHDMSKSEKTSEDTRLKQSGASAWLSNAPSKFPYLIAISPGDNPVVVMKKLLQGAKVLGSYEEQTYDTLKRFTYPTTALGRAAHRTAARYVELKTIMYEAIPVAIDFRAGMKAEQEGVMLDAMLNALRDLRYSEKQSKDIGEGSGENASANPHTDQAIAQPVFLLRDFDALSDMEAERWLVWTHRVLSEGLAYVVLITAAAVTPFKAKWLQTRHQNGLRAAALDGTTDFIGILLRPANGLVDNTSAEDKLREIAKLHNLRLFPASDVTSNDNDCNSDTTESNHSAEIEAILKATGNWWSDIDGICRRLWQNKLSTVTLSVERLAMIHEVCNDFVEDIETGLVELLHLNRSLQLPHTIATSSISESSFSVAFDDTNDVVKTSELLTALGTWKCLEKVAGVVPITGGSFFVGSPQQLLGQKDNAPLNCASPVDALVPFQYQMDGEQKFLDLIDQQLLFLRPKDAVEIGVIPCKPAALVSPCWIQTRPVVKKAFEKIHRNDAYFRAILDMDRFAAIVEMRREVEQYEQEVAERRKALLDMKRDFTILQFSMTPAEKAQRKAELALIDVELQAKDTYLEKLRSLQKQ
ncbi:unnamed protein product [Peronospora belbahrii]|uniref:Mitochondrial import inner membrane translocase subunit TIM54 n=1 Tax=Peronospora belbahrii TaxID=622444 RepID=A0ABN8CQW0_9STRA|nr:unnamed protein product [Peronospora belbahrii]